MQKPAPLGHEAIHETVEKILQAEKRGRVLDIPAGEGALALRLRNLDYEVVSCERRKSLNKLTKIGFVYPSSSSASEKISCLFQNYLYRK